MAADYLQALDDRKIACSWSARRTPKRRRITAEIRSQLRDAGKLGQEEREFTRLVAARASEAERGLAATYRPGDVLQFHQNAKGGFTKGERLTVTDPALVPLPTRTSFPSTGPRPSPSPPATSCGSPARSRRWTASTASATARPTPSPRFTKGGDLRLDNGWVVPKDAGHFRHGFVDTSFGSQGKTVDRAIVAMSTASLGATNAEQMYVSSTRAREGMVVYTDDKAAVRDGVQRSSQKAAALDLPAERPAPEAAHRERLRQNAARRARQTVIDRFRAAWNGPPAIQPQPQPPRGGGNHPPPTHSGRLRSEQQDQGMTHGR